MADTKISALPAVAVPAVGDEFACNQAGVTKKETKAQITAATDANLAAHAAVTAAGVHGSSVLTANDTLVHRSAAGLAHAVAFRADAGAVGAPVFTFTADPNTGHYNYAADELGIATGGAHRAHWNTTGAVILNNAAASAFMTGPGITIQQGAYDDEAVAIKSTDVAHGMIGLTASDNYFTVTKQDANAGGALLRGWRDADGAAGGAASLHGFLGENADTTKTAAGRAITEVAGFIKSGATIGDTNADGNVFGVRTRRGGADVTLLLVDEDGDLHVFNDIVVAGVVDGVDVAAHVAAAVIDHPNNSVTDVKIRDSAATSVIGRAGAGVGDPADIVAGADNQVLARTAGTVAFQAVVPAMVTDRTRKFYVPVTGGWNIDDGLAIHIETDLGIEMPDLKDCYAFAFTTVPEDFASGMTVTPVIVPLGNGNCYGQTNIRYGQCGEDRATHTDTSGAMSAVAVTTPDNNCIHQATLTNEAIGDILVCRYRRDGGDVLDTIGQRIGIAGFIVEYTADS